MDERLAQAIRTRTNLQDLARLEGNIQIRDGLTEEVRAAIDDRSGELAHGLVAERAGLDLSGLTPAEEKILQAAAKYAGIKIRSGTNANRTLAQIKQHGLIGAAEAAVSKSKATLGFQTLSDAGFAEISYEQIVVEHPEEFAADAVWFARRTLGLPNASPKPPARAVSRVNELTADLLAWLKARRGTDGRIPVFTNQDAASGIGLDDLRTHGRAFGNVQSRLDFACYRANLPPLGLSAAAPFEGAWRAEGRTWAFPVAGMQAAAQGWPWMDEGLAAVAREMQALPGQAHALWRAEMADHEEAVRSWAFGMLSTTAGPAPKGAGVAPAKSPPVAPPQAADPTAGAPYWVFVCNPKKWAVDRFLDRRVERDSWGVRPSDREWFAPGQLGIVRVGVDRRSAAERRGAPPMEAGVYAVCEVESTAFAGTGASDDFWAEDAARKPGWPTVKLRYLKSFLGAPLTIGRMRAEAPGLSPHLLNGFQAASFPIDAADFHKVMQLLGASLDHLPAPGGHPPASAAELAELEHRYLQASPEVKERVSRFVERGPVGGWAKRRTGYRCQVCDAMGLAAVGFKKRGGEPYVEAHHVMPVAAGHVGSLALSNIMTVCANHHRQLHYGDVRVAIAPASFDIEIDDVPISVPRLAAPTGVGDS